MKNRKPLFFSALLSLLATVSIYAQQQPVTSPGQLVGQEGNPIITAVPFLMIAPDARSAGMGDVGAATSPDANATYWNPAKLAFAKDNFGASLAYNPWLAKFVDDMSLSYLSGYYKLNKRQVVAMSMRYFDLGDIQFTDDLGNETRNFNPREFSFDATFAMQLSKRFSMGVSGRYIYSNLAGSINGSSTSTGLDSRPGHSVAFDVSAYWENPELTIAGYQSKFALGANLSNVGLKLSYTDENQEDFIPTNLRLGSALTTEFDPYNKITWALDVNKLLVPTPQEDGSHLDKSLFDGMFGSFTDAPGGFSEEMEEFGISTGLEYWYNQMFAARFGYFYENPNKGDRQYFTLGVGLRYQVFGFDFSYLISNKRNHPLEDTLRFAIMLNFGDAGKSSSGPGGTDMLDDDI
ncbi:type IX secretion system outer membrane channel protein PorV [Limibacter armeniacum]|uniref:type IX secretion system outer membrane channel protein PorV n=1 Tax=Limibacter armeniacum TaxID=466084 RepID=UPI002FE67D17